MLPAVYGCSAQQSSASAPSIAIQTITFQTKSYGTTDAAGQTAIPVSDQITTVLDSTNSFTVPTDGLAQYYSNNDASQQVFHTMTVGYTASNFSITDLPTDGNCQFIFETTLANTPANSQLNTWPLEGTTEGAFLPSNSKQTGVRITTTASLNRDDVFPRSPVVGSTAAVLANGVQILGGAGIVVGDNETSNLRGITFAAQNLGSSSSFDLVVKVLLGDGSTVSSPAQTITIPSGAVKTNLVIPANPTVNSFTTTTIGYGLQIAPPGAPAEEGIQSIPLANRLVSTLNAANSFTTPNVDFGNNIGMVENFEDPVIGTQQLLHTFQFNLDTSALTLADFPATGLIVSYSFTVDADAGGVDPSQGILWNAELGQVVTPTNTPPSTLFTYTSSRELTGINTNTLIPATPGDPAFASIDFPIVGSESEDYTPGFKAYNISTTGVPTYTLDCVISLQKTDGSFATTSQQLIIDAENGVAVDMS